MERRYDRVGEVEFLVQQALVHLDVPRLIHHLRRGIELRLDVGHLLDDLRGANESALLSVQELRKVMSLRMAPQVCTLFVGQAFPNRRSKNREILVRQLLRIFRIKIERPIDTTAGIPLQLLALLVESVERFTAVLVLPLETALEVLGHEPFGALYRLCIAVNGRHRLSPWT